MRARAIGLMRMADEGERDDKIISVHVDDPAVNEYRDIGELPSHLRREVQRFFEDYKALEDKTVVIDDFLDHEAALEAVRASFALYRREENRLRGW